MAKVTLEELQERIINIIGEQIFGSVEEIKTEITESKNKIKLIDLGCDELDYVEIIMVLEREFNVNIPDEDIPYLYDAECTIENFVNSVFKLL